MLNCWLDFLTHSRVYIASRVWQVKFGLSADWVNGSGQFLPTLLLSDFLALMAARPTSSGYALDHPIYRLAIAMRKLRRVCWERPLYLLFFSSWRLNALLVVLWYFPGAVLGSVLPLLSFVFRSVVNTDTGLLLVFTGYGTEKKLF